MIVKRLSRGYEYYIKKVIILHECAPSLELVYSLLANFAVPRRLCILWLSVQTAS